MDRAARLIHQALSAVESMVIPGVKTLKIAEEIDRFLVGYGADPGLVIRISPEDTVWHGIPDERKLLAGEIVSIDVACSVRGWWADTARTFPVGEVDRKRQLLMLSALEGTRKIVSLMKAGRTGRESADAMTRLCRQQEVSLIAEAAGHRIGRRLHELPSLTYDGRRHGALKDGYLYTAEPIFSAGNGEILISPNGSAVTGDTEPAAHYEVTVLLVNHGAHILGGADWFDRLPC